MAVAFSARSMARSSSPASAPAPPETGRAASAAPSERPRTQSSRDQARPDEAADSGSKRSSVSTSATSSPRRVAAAIADTASQVRPDEHGPTISDTCPRGNPPFSRSSSVPTPVAAIASAFAGTRGVDEVSVTSSLRVLRSCSRSARATALMRILRAPCELSLNIRYLKHTCPREGDQEGIARGARGGMTVRGRARSRPLLTSAGPDRSGAAVPRGSAGAAGGNGRRVPRRSPQRARGGLPAQAQSRGVPMSGGSSSASVSCRPPSAALAGCRRHTPQRSADRNTEAGRHRTPSSTKSRVPCSTTW